MIFKLKEKTDYEKDCKDKQIAIEYDNIIDDETYRQMTLEDLRKESEDRDYSIDKSKYPLLKSMFFEYNDAQLNQLVIAARTHLIPDCIKKSLEDLFIADLISEYYGYIKSTPEQTKTSEFARLYDCVKSDYKSVSINIIDKYSISPKKGDKIDLRASENVIEVADTDESDDMFESRMLNILKGTE